MAKKILVLLVILAAFQANKTYGQRIMGEAIFGMNLSKIEGDLINNGSFKFNNPGLNMGVGAIIPINDLFAINIQTIFSQKGAYEKYGPYADSARPYYKTSLDYAEVPFLFSYHDKNGLTFSTGVSYSRLVRAKWVVNGREIGSSTNDGFFRLNNFDWIADFKYKIWKSARINIQYQYGITSVWSGDDDDLLVTQGHVVQKSFQQNSTLSIRLVWVFGEKQSKQVREGVE